MNFRKQLTMWAMGDWEVAQCTTAQEAGMWHSGKIITVKLPMNQRYTEWINTTCVNCDLWQYTGGKLNNQLQVLSKVEIQTFGN